MKGSRRHVRNVLAIGAPLLALGCSLITELNGLSGGDGADAATNSPVLDGAGTADAPSSPPVDAGAAQTDATKNDARAPIVDASPCVRPDGRALANGIYCGNNGTEPWPNDHDLITCTNGKHTYRECNKCFKSSTGLPDVCDECAALPDGKYCGDQFPITDDVTMEVTCKGGIVSAVRECPNKCFHNGTTATECRL